MRHKHTYLVGMIRIDVVRVGFAQAVRKQQITLATVPLAADPANVVHHATG